MFLVVFWCCVQHPSLFVLYYAFSYIPIIHAGHDLSFLVHSVCLNRFQTGHCECLANLHQRWGFDKLVVCEGLQQTMKYTVEMCPITKVEGGLQPTLDINIHMETCQMCKTVRMCIKHKHSYRNCHVHESY